MAVLLYSALAAGAETSKPRLKMFGDEPNPHGLWKTELLEASDPALMANAKRMSEMAVCMDAGLEKGKDVKPSESACTRAVLKNTSSESQIETKCPERPTTVMTMKRESKDIIFFETVEKGKGGVTTTMKGRYHYVGPCSAERQPDQGRQGQRGLPADARRGGDDGSGGGLRQVRRRAEGRLRPTGRVLAGNDAQAVRVT